MTDIIELGSTYKDQITGFEGVATGYTQYITGCNQVLLQPYCTRGKFADMQEPEWVDEQRLDLIPSKRKIEVDNRTTLGFGPPAPKR